MASLRSLAVGALAIGALVVGALGARAGITQATPAQPTR
jgi:hypothetical protein